MSEADKSLTIAIKTTADTSGAAATERAIDQVGEAAKDAERKVDDLATAKERYDQREERFSKLRNETFGASEGSGFGGMLDHPKAGTDTGSTAKATGQTDASAGGFEFGKAKALTGDDLAKWKAANVEADNLLVSIGRLKNAALELAPHVAAVYGTLTSSFGQVKQAYDDMAKADPAFAEKNAGMIEAVNAIADPVAAAKEAWNDLKTTVAGVFDSMVLGGAVASAKAAAESASAAAKMKAQWEELKKDHQKFQDDMLKSAENRMQRMLAIEARAENRGLANAGAVDAAGGPADATTADGAARMARAQQRGERSTEIEVEETTRIYNEAVAAMQQFAGQTGAQAEAARAAVDESKENMDAAEENLRTLREVQKTTMSKAVDEATKGMESDVTEQAVKMEAALSAEVEKLGTAASSRAKEALQTLRNTLADGQVKADELDDVNGAMARLRQAMEGRNAKVLEAMDKIVGIEETHTRALDSHKSRIEALESKVSTLGAMRR